MFAIIPICVLFVAKFATVVGAMAIAKVRCCETLLLETIFYSPLIGQKLTPRSHLDTGHWANWACGLVLTAARNATLYRDIFISNNP